MKLFKLAAVAAAVALLASCSMKVSKISEQSRYDTSQKDLQKIMNAQPTLKGNLSLSDAIARTLKFNLDNRIRLTRLALANGQLKLAVLQMLPTIDTSLGYKGRSNQKKSFLIQNGQLSTSDTTVNPRETHDADVVLNWNLLDLGLSYVRSKQQADRVLVAKEQRRQIVQDLVKQVTATYWRAYNAQSMYQDVEAFRDKVAKALALSQKATASRAGSAEKQLEYQKMLISSLRQVSKMRAQMIRARQELSKLMSVDARSQFILMPPSKEMVKMEPLKLKIQQLDTLALVNRPELKEMDYKVRIADRGITTAILNALPSIKFDLGYNYDSNKYEVQRNWISWNSDISWNVLNLLSAAYSHKVAKTQKQLEQLQRMATTMTVLTQVRLSLVDYQLARQEFSLSVQKNAVNEKLFKHTEKRAQAKASNQQQVIRRSLDYLNSRMDRALAFSGAQDAKALVLDSVGVDVLPAGNYDEMKLTALSKLVQQNLDKVNNKGLNSVLAGRYQTIASQLSILKSLAVKPAKEAAAKATPEAKAKAETKTEPKTKAAKPAATKSNTAKKGHFSCNVVKGKWQCDSMS